MGDPRSKPKAPKIKENRSPHTQQQQQQNMKAAAPPPPQKMVKAAGRGR